MKIERNLIICCILLLKKNVSSSLTENFNGFHIVRIEAENGISVIYYPIDIIYDPVKHFKIKINCFFSTDKRLHYRSTYNVNKKDKKIKYSKASQCYYCSNYYMRKGKYYKHSKHCSGIPVIL